MAHRRKNPAPVRHAAGTGFVFDNPFAVDASMIEASLPLISSDGEREGGNGYSALPLQAEGAVFAAPPTPVQRAVGRKRVAPTLSVKPVGEPSPKATKYVKKGRGFVAVKPKTRRFCSAPNASESLHPLCSFVASVVEGVVANGEAEALISLTAGEAVATLSVGETTGNAVLSPSTLKNIFVSALAVAQQVDEGTVEALLNLLVEENGPIGLTVRVQGGSAFFTAGWLQSSMPKTMDDVAPNKHVQYLMCALFGHMEDISTAFLPGSSCVTQEVVFEPATLYKMLKPIPLGEAPATIHGLVTRLRDYQQQAVQWMLHREASDGSKQRPFEQWWPIPEPAGDGSTVLWYNQFVGCVTDCKALTSYPDVLKGGILAEEMGLGKTLEMMAVILSNKKTNLSQERSVFGRSIPRFSERAFSSSSFSTPADTSVVCYCRGERSPAQLSLGLSNCIHCGTEQHNYCMGIRGGEGASAFPYLCPSCARLDITGTLPSGATLIVTPAAIQEQWRQELIKHTDPRHPLKIAVYEGISVVSNALNGNANALPEPYLVRAEHFDGYDVVLTTYAVLRSDLNHAKTNERSLHFRKGKVHTTPVLPTPLLALKWWRVCMDEAQMVGTGTQKAAEMVVQIPAEHRWCVTGTPIQRKGAVDLRGLFHFLQIPYFCEKYWFRKCIELPCQGGEVDFAMRFLTKVLGDIFWRNSKADVDKQLHLPAQTDLTHKLRFAPVEAYFYKKQHEECSSRTRALLADKMDGSFSTKPLAGGNKDIDKLLQSVLKLRQACCHPQVAGVVLAGGGGPSQTISMGQLLDSLILKATVECEEVQRQWVCSMCALAALHLVEQQETDRQQARLPAHEQSPSSADAITAASLYLEILSVSAQHSSTIRIDTVQRLHVLHNLAVLFGQINDAAGVYSNKHSVAVCAAVANTLRSSRLLEEAEELRAKYAQKERAQYMGAQQQLTLASEKVAQAMSVDEFCAETRAWWESPVLKESGGVLSSEQLNGLVQKLRDDLLEQRSLLTDTTASVREHRLRSSLANRFQNADQLRVLLAGEIFTLYEDRESLLQFLHSLKPSEDRDVLRCQVLELLSCRCHKRRNSNPASQSDAADEDVEELVNAYSCKHCHCLRMQARFERLLYHDSTAKIAHNGDEPGAAEGQAELMGSKHDSDFVFLLKELSRFFVSHSRSLAAVTSGSYYPPGAAQARLELEAAVTVIKRDLEVIDVIRKELRFVRKLWQVQRHQFLVEDEMEQAITRMRLALPHEIAAGIPENERNYKILRHQVPELRQRHSQERDLFLADLGRHKGQLKYLLNLKNRKAGEHDDVIMMEASALANGHGSSQMEVEKQPRENEECAICTETLKKDQVSVLACGHEYCCECVTDLIERSKPARTIRCPTCRFRMNVDEVAFVIDQSKASLLNAGFELEEIRLAQQVADINVAGSWGTKVEAIVRRVLWLLRKEVAEEGETELTPGGKIIIFSQWDLVLRIIVKALKANNVQHSSMLGNRQTNQRALSTFKTLPAVRVLLLPVKSGSNGLNLVEATHVFLAEPLLNPAAEAQALGRIHRIGQTRPTFVHRFVVQNTVEESIAKLMARKKGQMNVSLDEGDVSGWGAQKSERDVLTAADLWECFCLQ